MVLVKFRVLECDLVNFKFACCVLFVSVCCYVFVVVVVVMLFLKFNVCSSL